MCEVFYVVRCEAFEYDVKRQITYEVGKHSFIYLAI